MSDQAGALPASPAVAVVVCRDGRLPAGAAEAVAEAGGAVVVAGTGAEEAVAALPAVDAAWWWETPAGPAGLADTLSGVLAGARCIIVPASPDGRDLAPRLAASMGRPLLAGAVRVCHGADGSIRAELLRVDGQVVVPAEVEDPAVVTLLPGARGPAPAAPGAGQAGERRRLVPHTGPVAPADAATSSAPAGRAPGADTPSRPGPSSSAATTDPDVLAVIAPDPATMDLADATRVLGGGAGLVPPNATDDQSRAVFALLTAVAAGLGASAGATRVVTDAGWAGHDRQIGTTGVSIDPELYVAFGVSGASQHTGGLGAPRHIVSINIDPACPMTALADLGIVADATGLLVEVARRLGVVLPAGLEDAHG
jgi:electron transfer flavoprotein alpha subunit